MNITKLGIQYIKVGSNTTVYRNLSANNIEEYIYVYLGKEFLMICHKIYETRQKIRAFSGAYFGSKFGITVLNSSHT